MCEAAKNQGFVGAVGTFDGFHLGHRAIIDRMLAEARPAGKPTCVLTFENHPLSVIAPDRAPGWAYPRRESARLIAEAGVDRIVSLPFTPELKSLTAADFMALMRRDYGIDTLVMGFDNTFGSDRLTSPDDYAEPARSAGIRLVRVPRVELPGGLRPSSSALRDAIAHGDLDRYRLLSGHTPMLEGTVVAGKQNGRRIGIPTMNLDTGNLALPPDGVYAADYEGLPAVLNIGKNPTVGDANRRTVELHVPGTDLGDMYGRRAAARIVSFLRPERRFDSLEALRDAIAADISAAMNLRRR